MELYSAMSKEIVSFAGECVHLESIILCAQSLYLFFKVQNTHNVRVYDMRMKTD